MRLKEGGPDLIAFISEEIGTLVRVMRIVSQHSQVHGWY